MTSLGEGGARVVHVLQISDDIDKPEAYSSEVAAKDRAALAAHDRGVTLEPWVNSDDGGFMRAESARALFTIYRCPVRESPHES
ncbi:MAG: hypothetical protein JO037_21115 [Actinobacteria bacterium]|nr:hypothetical protein [Actinomycetota bacterium]